MTRKHFRAIASAMARHREDIRTKPPQEAFNRLLSSLISELRYTNPRFCDHTFREACGGKLNTNLPE